MEPQYSIQEQLLRDNPEPALAQSELDRGKSVRQRRQRYRARYFHSTDNSRNNRNRYSCPLCRRTYTAPCRLRAHVWVHTHTLDEWYECRTCHMSFATCFDVVRHLLLHQALTYSIRRLWPSYTCRRYLTKYTETLKEARDTGTSSFGIFDSCATMLHGEQSIVEYAKWRAEVCAARIARYGISGHNIWDDESQPENAEMDTDQHRHSPVTKIESGTGDVSDTSLGNYLGNTASSMDSFPTLDDSDVQETDVTVSTWSSSPETTEGAVSPWPDSPNSAEQDGLIRPATCGPFNG